MFTSFLKITLRNLYREKMYALINISGLSIAIACCLILGLYLRSEFTYDRYNLKCSQIFRMIRTDNFVGSTPMVPSALGPILAKDYPEIKNVVRFSFVPTEGEPVIRHGDRSFQWNNIWYADNCVFDVFTHDILYGDPKTALVDPTSVAVSRTFSEKYFGDANPIAETIRFNNKTYKIMLVFDDLPDNSSLKYDILLSYQEKELADTKKKLMPFQQIDCTTYLLMPDGYAAQDFKPISDVIYSRYMANNGGGPNNATFSLQPLPDIHFNSNIIGAGTANKFYIYGFTAVAVFILLVACINYMNLATARAAKRAKEVGMRKILGAGKSGLRLQFLAEAVFFSLIALFFGLVLVEIALNLTPINDLLNKHLALNLGHEPGLFFEMIFFSLIIGLMAGSYPAFYLSSMPVLSTLTGGHRAGKGGIRFRQALVLLQFTITVSVIGCTLLMALQMRYVSRKPLGFEKENRIMITLYGKDVIEKIPIIKKELLKNDGILEIAQSSENPGQVGSKFSTTDMNGNTTTMSFLLVDDNFIRVMGMKIVSGRDFKKRLLTDVGSSIIVNQTLAKGKGWDEPLGQRIMKYQVIGVVKDFNLASLHNPIEPLGMMRFGDFDLPSLPNSIPRRFLFLHISGKNVSRTLSFLENKFAEFDPKHPFHYEFLDDALAKLYLSEQKLMKLIGSFGGICVLISCLGLFGLSAFATEQRTKEIGVRKVLGASTKQIILMLFQNILLLVFGGAVIASLIAYYVMDEWLTSFAYRTGINPLVFIISALLAAGVAFITVALQSYKTARANPVIALRYE